MLALVVSAQLLPSASPAEVQREPRAIAYDPTRLATYSTEDLIDLLSEASLRQNGIENLLPADDRWVEAPAVLDPRLFARLGQDSHVLDFTGAVQQQLVTRRAVPDLLRVFAVTTDWFQQAWVLAVLTRLRGPEVDSALRGAATNHGDHTSYFALKYFALACDAPALATLNRSYGDYPVPSIEWASIVRSFGACRYEAAAPNLVKSVSAGILELAYASHRSLLALYPDAEIDFRDPFEAEEEWKRYLTAHR
jgi:hypothetical protein